MGKNAIVRLFCLVLATLLATAPPARAARDSFDSRSFTCPVGAKTFVQDVGYDSFPLVTLPDGSWLGDDKIDVQIPVCPDNGLVLMPDYRAMTAQSSARMIYRDYSPAELAQLPTLIADPAYRALKGENRHAQAYWLAVRLGAPAYDRFQLLQRASWAATDPALRLRRVALLAADTPALIESPDVPADEKPEMRYYLINALRELGRFDEALRMLDAAGDLPHATAMRAALEDRDDGRFPAALLDRRLLSAVCDGSFARLYGPPGAATLAACKRRRTREAQQASNQDAAIEGSIALRRDPQALAAHCTATPEAARPADLKLACEALQDERDEAQADAMVKDGPALAAACEATPEDEQKGALRHACISYTLALEGALGQAIAGDDQAWAILCPGGGDAEVEDRDSHVSLACFQAGQTRDERHEAALLADPAKIDAQCRGDHPAALERACDARKRQKETQRIERLASDPAAFTRECGRFRRQIAASQFSDGSDPDEGLCRSAFNLGENRKAIAAAEARGLVCFADVIYSPDRPRCVTQAAYAEEQARDNADPSVARLRDGRFDADSSLTRAASVRAAAIIAAAKISGTYPRKPPGSRF